MYVSSPPDDKTETGVANHKLRFKIGQLAWACFAALDALDQLVDRMAADTLHREHDGSQRRVEHSGIHRIIDVVNGVLFLATPGISKDSFSIRSSMTQYILPRLLHRSLHPARRFLPVPLADAVRRKKEPPIIPAGLPQRPMCSGWIPPRRNQGNPDGRRFSIFRDTRMPGRSWRLKGNAGQPRACRGL